MITDYQRSIDDYSDTNTELEDLSPDDLISLVNECNEHYKLNFKIPIPAYELSKFFLVLTLNDRDEIYDLVQAFKVYFLDNSAEHIKRIRRDIRSKLAC